MAQGTIVLDNEEQIYAASVIALRSALRLQVRGIKLSRGVSALAIAKQRGFTTKGTAKGALADLDAYCAEHFGL